MSPTPLCSLLLLACALTPILSQKTDSCRGRCGTGYYRGYLCQCDYNCMGYGECCLDFESECTTKNSCRGRCGESFKRGRLCSCDSDCVKFKQCCPDYKIHCDAEEETGNEAEKPSEALSGGNNEDNNEVPLVSPTSFPQDDANDEESQTPESASGYGSSEAEPLDAVSTQDTLITDTPQASTETVPLATTPEDEVKSTTIDMADGIASTERTDSGTTSPQVTTAAEQVSNQPSPTSEPQPEPSPTATTTMQETASQAQTDSQTETASEKTDGTPSFSTAVPNVAATSEPTKELSTTLAPQDPSQESSTSSVASPEPSQESSTSSVPPPEPSQESSTSSVPSPEPSQESSTSSVPSPEPSQESSTSSVPSPEPSQESSTSPEPSQESSTSSVPSPEPSQESSTSSVPSPEPSQESSTSSVPPPEPSQESSTSSVPSPEPSQESSTSSVPSPEPSQESSTSPEPSQESSTSSVPSPEPSQESSTSSVSSPEPSQESSTSSEPSQQSSTSSVPSPEPSQESSTSSVPSPEPSQESSTSSLPPPEPTQEPSSPAVPSQESSTTSAPQNTTQESSRDAESSEAPILPELATTATPTTSVVTTGHPTSSPDPQNSSASISPVGSDLDVTTTVNPLFTDASQGDSSDEVTPAEPSTDPVTETQKPTSPESTPKPQDKPNPSGPLITTVSVDKPVLKPGIKPVDAVLTVDSSRDYQADDSNDTNLCNGRPANAITTLRNGTIAIFRGHYFWLLDRNRVPGPARDITQAWGVPSPIDTVFTRCNCQGKTYIFKGNQYWRFENNNLDPGYPKVVETGFDGLQGRITAALSVPQYRRRRESVYFFKTGGTVQKYSYQFGTTPSCNKKPSYAIYTVRNRVARQTVSLLGPTINIRTAWRGFPTTITSAVSVPSYREPEGYKYYVFSRTKSYNIRIDGDRPVVTSPRENPSAQNNNLINCPKTL
ncbi:proteoglycan 4b isoform X3 [Festucalex cinctus]